MISLLIILTIKQQRIIHFIEEFSKLSYRFTFLIQWWSFISRYGLTWPTFSLIFKPKIYILDCFFSLSSFCLIRIRLEHLLIMVQYLIAFLAIDLTTFHEIRILLSWLEYTIAFLTMDPTTFHEIRIFIELVGIQHCFSCNGPD